MAGNSDMSDPWVQRLWIWYCCALKMSGRKTLLVSTICRLFRGMCPAVSGLEMTGDWLICSLYLFSPYWYYHFGESCPRPWVCFCQSSKSLSVWRRSCWKGGAECLSREGGGVVKRAEQNVSLEEEGRWGKNRTDCDVNVVLLRVKRKVYVCVTLLCLRECVD